MFYQLFHRFTQGAARLRPGMVFILCGFFCAGLASVSTSIPARAESPGVKTPVEAPDKTEPDTTEPDKTENAKLLSLGEDFARRIGGSLEKANLYLSGAGKLELAEHRAGTILPDGEPLLLQAFLGKEAIAAGQSDLYTIKRKNHLMISLADFIGATGFAIKVDSEKGRAEGWFTAPEHKFFLDVKQKTVTIAGQARAIPPGAVETDPDTGQILVSAAALEKWFGVSFDYDFAQLTITITGRGKLPKEAQALRTRVQKPPSYYNDSGPKLPVRETRYGLLSLPYIDTDLNGDILHSPGQQATRMGNWSTMLSGDYAGMNVKAYTGGTAKEPYLDTARVTLGRDDASGNLLGPLHATRYQFGDVGTVSNTLIGGSAMERGVYVTNKALDNITAKTTTPLHGDAHPGWDVELFRNESFIDIRHVGNDGRYDFGDVPLIAGKNDFKFVFFGPHGERREEHRLFGVDQKALENSGGHYEFSLTQQQENLWQRFPVTGPDAGALRASASYERGIPGLGLVDLGLRNASDQGKRRTFAQGGLATYFMDMFFNVDVGVDAETGDFSSIITARRNFGKHAFILQEQHNSVHYNIGVPDGVAATQDGISLNVTGPLMSNFLFFRNMTYTAGSAYTTFYNDTVSSTANANVTARAGSVVFNVGAQTSATNGPTGDSRTTTLSYNASGRLFGGSWRTASSYQLLPEDHAGPVEMDYTRSIADDISSTATLSYDPQTRFGTGALALNWDTPYAAISPRVQYDTSRNLDVGVNVHFAAGADPYTHDYHVYDNYLTGSGGVAARIFQDKNGNGIFDAGDKLLPDVGIVAVQGQQNAISNKDGIAFIPDLPANRLTDIVVNPSSQEDAYGISLFKGLALRPHAGAVEKIDFPIVDSGELDGQADIADSKGTRKPAQGTTMALVTPSGRVEKTAFVASDGYWSMSTITPGIYYLTADSDDGVFVPRLLQFKPDGTFLFGQGVMLESGPGVSFVFTSKNLPPDGFNHARVIRKTDILTQETEISLGGYHSRLALVLGWYGLRLRNAGWVAHFGLAAPLERITADVKTGMMALRLRPKSNMSPAQAAAACRTLERERGDSSLSCTVHVITTYGGKPVPEQETEKPAAMVAQAKEDIPAPVAPVKGAKLSTENAHAPVAVNVNLAKAVPEKRAVLLNLGYYNSRMLMMVVWYKLKTQDAAFFGDARPLIRLAQSQPVSAAGGYVLRVAMPGNDVAAAQAGCKTLIASGQVCAVETGTGTEEE